MPYGIRNHLHPSDKLRIVLRIVLYAKIPNVSAFGIFFFRNDKILNFSDFY